MSELRKANFDAVFFVTLTVVDWIDIFSRQEYTDLLINNLKFCQEHKGLEIFAYVVMTNHLHLVVSQKDGRLNDVLRDFKSYTSKALTTPAMMEQKIVYTHLNPVRAGYVLEPEHWKYSSANVFSPITVIEV